MTLTSSNRFGNNLHDRRMAHLLPVLHSYGCNVDQERYLLQPEDVCWVRTDEHG